jgi:hypothetical protein
MMRLHRADPRNCEEPTFLLGDVAIQHDVKQQTGLLRCARNDDVGMRL